MKIVILIFEEPEVGGMIHNARCQNCSESSPGFESVAAVIKWARHHAKNCERPDAWTNRGSRRATLLSVQVTEL